MGAAEGGGASWYEAMALPALLRAARRGYGSAVRAALEAAGYGDLPPNGPFVIGAIALNGSPLSEIIDFLGVSKQAAGQLVDTLVTRGYLERSVDPLDRRRLTIALSERGRHAAGTVGDAVARVDAELVAVVGRDRVQQTRATLAALIELAEHEHEQSAGGPS